MKAPTLYGMFRDTALQYPDNVALKSWRSREFAEIRYGELLRYVDIAADNLRRLGIGSGDRVGIYSTNRPEWVITDLATLKLGASVVPLYPSTTESMLAYIINNCQMKLMVVENHELGLKLSNVLPQAASLKYCIGMEPIESVIPGALDFHGTFLESCCIQAAAAQGSATDVATIVYTSGTTGNPKGVMLSHENIVANAQSVITRFRVTPADVTVSYLPLCHMFERTCGYYAVLLGGGTIAYATSITTVAADVARIRPTILIAVPRVIEKAFEEAVRRVHEKSRWNQWLVSAAMSSLNLYTNRRFRHDHISLSLRLKRIVFNRVVGSAFRQLAGGRLRLIASGGAPLDRKVAKAFHILGFNIVEGYGLTEAAPVVCCNSPFENVLGSVGKPMDGVEVRIADTGEVLVKGPNVMLGYYGDPEATAKAIDGTGWLHTGDLGQFDEQGNLAITGRIKDIIVTSYGKNIGPAAIEATLLRSPYIHQAVIFGDKRKYLSALMVPDGESMCAWARSNGFQADCDAIINHPAFRRLISQEIEQATRECSSYEKPKDFRLIREEFTIENGLMTPTLKPRRAAIAEKYSGLIESMYHSAEDTAHA